jgi:uncharacterized lipoprotein
VSKAGFVLIIAVLFLAGCGGDTQLKCESGGAYLSAVEKPRVRAPEGLDDLDPIREAPLPDASPRSERWDGSGCLEAPPRVGRE